MEEIWKDVPNYEGHYMVSNYGIVKSLKLGKEKVLKHGTNPKSGYSYVNLCKNGNIKNNNIHQIVAIAFLNHTPCGYKLVINHKDFDRSNNRLDNLEIVTQRENTNFKHIKSTSQYTGVAWYKKTNRWVASVSINCKLKHLGYFKNEIEASQAYQRALKELS